MAASFKTISFNTIVWQIALKFTQMSIYFKTIVLVYFQHNDRTAHIPKTHIPLALWGPADGIWGEEKPCHPHVGSIQYSPRQMVCQYCSIVGFLGTEGFKWWQHLEISKDEELKNILENIFTSFTNTLEVSMSQWNYIDEMYSDIQQGEQETTDQLNQCIKILVERCGYASTEEKMRCQLELLFHVMKHFKVKKWVRSLTTLKETVTFDKLLQHAKQHEATIKDFQWHKSNGGVVMSTTINEIRTFKRKGQGSQARTRSKGKIRGRCRMSHPPRKCPAWGKKCHKCGNKNHFSTHCRSKWSGGEDRRSCSTSRGHKGKGRHQQSRLRSNQATKNAYSMESASFQDHPDLHGEKTDNLHGESADLHGQRGDLHGTQMVPNSLNSHFLQFLHLLCCML